MRALIYMGPGEMQLQDLPDPTSGPGEVTIASTASAICGSDLHGFRESSPRRIPPLIMGHETVGRIVEVGEGVPGSRAGERVVLKPIVSCGSCEWCSRGAINHCASGRLVGRDLSGGFAERFVVPAQAAVRLEVDVTDEVATLTEPIANAVHVVARSVTEGDLVFVIGAGPIGVLMAKTALLEGARRALITDPLPGRLVLAQAQGAEAVTGDDPAAAVIEMTGGRGADVVIDAAGYEATWAMGLRAVRTAGRICAVGLGAGSGSLDYFAVIGKELTITGSYAWGEDDFARALSLLADGAFDFTDWITTMPLAEGQRAFQELAQGVGGFKVVLVP